MHLLLSRSVGHLGSGQFANVEEGTWKKGVNKEVRIALKTMKPGSTEEDKIKFLQEAAIMAQFRHPNVIGLYGVVSKGEPVSIYVCLFAIYCLATKPLYIIMLIAGYWMDRGELEIPRE